MSDPLAEKRQFTIVDPLHHDSFQTSLGVLQPSKGGYITTHNADLAQEIKAREPWALVTEHAPLVGGAKTRVMFTMPQMPWKKKESDAAEKG